MKHCFVLIFLCFLLALTACDRPEQFTQKDTSFLQIGEFTITKESDVLTLARDGAGRSPWYRGTPLLRRVMHRL